ncbi:hypothetical protein WMF37_31970 [Sorangium sp. So ce291]|uniref:hypothetical protein n=1 Tax=Sorangium sp. So ce291 TaxID=3133294 RepID=UPI003F5E86A1
MLVTGATTGYIEIDTGSNSTFYVDAFVTKLDCSDGSPTLTNLFTLLASRHLDTQYQETAGYSMLGMSGPPRHAVRPGFPDTAA